MYLGSIHNQQVVIYRNIESMKNNIEKILKNNCIFLENIIFSNNPHSI